MKDNIKIQALFHEFTSLSHIFVKVVTLLVQWSYLNQKAIKNMIFLIKYQILNRNPGCWWLSHKVTFLSIQLHEQIFLFFSVMSVYLSHQYPIFCKFSAKLEKYLQRYSYLKKPLSECLQTVLCFLNMFISPRLQSIVIIWVGAALNTF